MRKRSFAAVDVRYLARFHSTWTKIVPGTATLLLVGCAAPQYAVRQPPQPDESTAVIHFERAISAHQAKEFQQQGARRILPGERLWGFDVPQIVERLGRVTERPGLAYRPWLYTDNDPNAAALADGRVYLSSGMLHYVSQRGSRNDELAFIIAHELAHTTAQHLVKRYQTLRQQQLLVSLVSAGAAVATRGASEGVRQAGRIAVDAASLLRDVAISGYSQEQELEADQLGIRYVIRAGYNPQAAVDLLQDFARFDNPSPFFRTHPYMALRREYLQRYLLEQHTAAPVPVASDARRASLDAHRRHLRSIQQLYPRGSVSWQNLQRQIDALE
jgi:predicted Zn-dependent protease